MVKPTMNSGVPLVFHPPFPFGDDGFDGKDEKEQLALCRFDSDDANFPCFIFWLLN